MLDLNENLIFRPDGTVILDTGNDPAYAQKVKGWDRHVVGLDLGRNDPTAIVVLRDRCYPTWSESGHQELGKRQRVAVWHETIQMEDYTDIASFLITRLDQIPNWELVVDASGLGTPFSHVLCQAGIEHWAVSITAGAAVTTKGKTVWCAKNTLIENMATGLETGDLTIAHDLPQKDKLLNEIASFRLETSSAGNPILAGGGKGHHADAAIALALAYLRTTHLQAGSFSVSRLRNYY